MFEGNFGKKLLNNHGAREGYFLTKIRLEFQSRFDFLEQFHYYQVFFTPRTKILSRFYSIIAKQGGSLFVPSCKCINAHMIN